MSNNNIPKSDGTDLVKDISNWYSDRYGSVLIQRNILLILLVITLLCIIAGVFTVGNIAIQYTIKPFVIDIDKKSGITNIVDPLVHKDLSASEALNRYFITKYIAARETYCSVSAKYNYWTVVRLLSSEDIYRSFKRSVYEPSSPLNTYGVQYCSEFKLNSIQFFTNTDPKTGAEKTTSVVRFIITVLNGDSVVSKSYKIATLEYTYKQMELSMEDRNVNPLGFQITAYRSDQEINVNGE